LLLLLLFKKKTALQRTIIPDFRMHNHSRIVIAHVNDQRNSSPEKKIRKKKYSRISWLLFYIQWTSTV